MTLEERVEELESTVKHLKETIVRIVSKIGLPYPMESKDKEIVENLTEALQRMAEGKDPLPVDLNQRARTDGKPITGAEHTDIDPLTGQQEAYIVLTEAERAKGYVRPIRQSYIHTKCKQLTTMGLALAQTYAREPKFYTGTFCSHCKSHFPVGEKGEFVWPEDGSKVGT